MSRLTPIETLNDQEKAHMHDCWLAEGGPGHALSKKLDEMKWFLAKLIGALTLVAVLIPSAVALWTHYYPRPVHGQAQTQPETASLISQAHAETKGSTP